jgi:hypothetical protein
MPLYRSTKQWDPSDRAGVIKAMACIKSMVWFPKVKSTTSLTFAVAWTALEAEGFGASLQHFHFAPDVVTYMRKFHLTEAISCAC